MSGDPASNPAFVGVRQPAFDTMVSQHARAAARNGSGVKAWREPFSENGKILPPGQWINDSKKVDRFVEWCDLNDFVAPRIGQDLRSAIESSHDDAISSFNSANPGELRP